MFLVFWGFGVLRFCFDSFWEFFFWGEREAGEKGLKGKKKRKKEREKKTNERNEIFEVTTHTYLTKLLICFNLCIHLTHSFNLYSIPFNQI